MLVLHLTTHENTGAGKATLRLHQGLLAAGEKSLMLTAQKASGLATVLKPGGGYGLYQKAVNVWQQQVLRRVVRDRQTVFSLNFTPTFLAQQIAKLKPDIVHLHWIGWEFVNIKELARLGCPIVWTLHDSWAFTGGCHLPFDCTRYRAACGICPQLKSGAEHDLSYRVWRRKDKFWRDTPLNIVTPSVWLAECARQSSLLKHKRIEIIPNGLDQERYRPIAKAAAREALNLSQTKKYILFGAINSVNDRNKGFGQLVAALEQVKTQAWAEQTELLVFGSDPPDHPVDFGLNTHYLGRLQDDISIALLYSAADVFVAPSLQENLPNTVMEALACGTPCVAFRIGGLPDLIEHKLNGYLAKPYQVEDLAQGIAWVLGHPEPAILAQQARAKVLQQFTLAQVTDRYLALYAQILNQKGHEQ